MTLEFYLSDLIAAFFISQEAIMIQDDNYFDLLECKQATRL